MTFSPDQHLRNLKGQQYLDVKWRLLWLREEHPDAVIKTELAHLDLDQDLAIFRAEVTIPGQGSATGYGSETKQDFPQGWVEKAETKAIGRAVAALGFGTQFALELDDGERLVDTPAARSGTWPAARPAPAPTTAVTATATRPTDDMAREAAALKEEIKRLRPDLATPNGGYLLATLAKEMGRMVPATPADITIGYLRTLRDDIKARTAHAGSATATTTATDEPPLVERFLARLHEADQAHDPAAIDKVAQDAVMTHKTGALSDGEYDRVAEALDALRVTDDADTTHQSELVEALPF